MKAKAHGSQLTDAFIDSVRDVVLKHCRFLLLSNAMDATNGLKLERRMQERFDEHDILGADEVQASRVRARVKDEDGDIWIGLELLDDDVFLAACPAFEPGELDPIVAESLHEDRQRVGPRREQDDFAAWLFATNVLDVLDNQIGLAAERRDCWQGLDRVEHTVRNTA